MSHIIFNYYPSNLSIFIVFQRNMSTCFFSLGIKKEKDELGQGMGFYMCIEYKFDPRSKLVFERL